MKKEDRAIIFAYGRKWSRRDSEENEFMGMPDKEGGRRSGIYILYNKKRIVYIGKSESNKKALRGRIKDHTKDHLKKEWDSYTWFITKKRHTSDLEGLLHNIFWQVIDETRNKVKATINAKKYVQESRKRELRKKS